ncbi:proline utilization protein PrnX [Xylariomycetidae sp. FL2044]|nr:proline utilization protein PrnX [Xylariomycetidae sp. FL2044]
MLILGDDEVKAVLNGLTPEECQRVLDELARSLADYSDSHASSEKKVHQPLRQVFTTTAGHTSLFMPASNTVTTGAKIVTLPGNGGPPQGAINIFAPEGNLVGLVNAEEITAFRTALASMVIFAKSPTPKARIVVFGAGKQAEWHIKLALLLFGDEIKNIVVVNRSLRSIEKLSKNAADLRAKYPDIDLETLSRDGPVEEYESARKRFLQGSDAIMCCTPSTEPLFPFSDLASDDGSLPKARFISLIGSYKPNMHEIDEETLLSGHEIFVDSRQACLEEAGEIIKAQVPGDRLTEIGEVATKREVVSSTGSVIFKCVGMGIMDVVVTAALLKIAKEKNIGKKVDGF